MAEPHSHDGEHPHRNGPARGSSRLLARVRHVLTPHSHDAADQVDRALETSRRGLRALWVSLGVLGVTAGLQGVVAWLSGSVALLGDTLHNVADALTAAPLAVAFTVGRRPANRRYTHGYGRAEDLAGVAIVAVILASSALAAVAAVARLAHPAAVSHLPAVAGAGLLGFLGNEVVARYRIGVGREIGSAALVADGLHARTDGFTSLAVVAGAGGVALGLPWADAIVGLLITVAILAVLRDAARQVYRRLMDAVDEPLVDAVEGVLTSTTGVLAVSEVRVRWMGHALRAEARVTVDPDLSLAEGHRIADDAERRLLHEVPRLASALVHCDPEGDEHHAGSAHHG
ncbi:MAG: cation diffusion facilitator family transporter [Actinomycetota bacterium]|nr:cation diffusion facilitator family transporter [Actinomycetota bacterium]